MLLQHFAIRAQMNSLVVDDDTVEIEKDCLDHESKVPFSLWEKG
jgi:hypothetical protein